MSGRPPEGRAPRAPRPTVRARAVALQRSVTPRGNAASSSVRARAGAPNAGRRDGKSSHANERNPKRARTYTRTLDLSRAPKSSFRLPAEHRGVLAQDEREIALAHVRSLLEPPTAPYVEDAQVRVVRRFVAEREGFTLREDEHSNLIVTS